jgi:hypothetical protein
MKSVDVTSLGIRRPAGCLQLHRSYMLGSKLAFSLPYSSTCHRADSRSHRYSRMKQRRAYWQLPDFASLQRWALLERLKKQDYIVPDDARKDDLIDFNERASRHLICYDLCSLRELKTFVIDRKLLAMPTMAMGRYRLTNILKSGDKNPRFEKLFELPPEIREIIYEYYVDSFRTEPRSFTSPPLAQTCRQMRAEVVPIFYQRCTFQLVFREGHRNYEYPAYYNRRNGRTPLHLRQPLSLAAGTKISKVHFIVQRHAWWSKSADFTVKIRPSVQGRIEHYVVTHHMVNNETGEQRSWRSAIDRALLEILTVTNDTDGRVKKAFEPAELLAIRDAIYKIWDR